MAFFGSWLFTGDNPWPRPGSPTVQRYRTEDLRTAMLAAVTGGIKPYLAGDGPRQDVHATDFMTVDGDSMYTGNHGNPVPGLMYRYVLGPDGRLREVEGPWSVPPRAQGLIITPDDFIFSTDNNAGRGALVTVRRDAPSTRVRPIACIWMPAMPEDLTVHRGRVLSSFESGTARFADDDPTNRVTHLHAGSLTALLTAVDPVALDAERSSGLAPEQPLLQAADAGTIAGSLASALGPRRLLPGAQTAQPPGRSVELWTPTQHLSDAFDYYLSRRAERPVERPDAARVSDARDLYSARPDAH
jgi:hypothetical protein